MRRIPVICVVFHLLIFLPVLFHRELYTPRPKLTVNSAHVLVIFYLFAFVSLFALLYNIVSFYY